MKLLEFAVPVDNGMHPPPVKTVVTHWVDADEVEWIGIRQARPEGQEGEDYISMPRDQFHSIEAALKSH